MTTYAIPFTLPTTRVDGSSLATSEIKQVSFFVSTDNGLNYADAGHADPASGVFQFEATDAGTYLFKDEVIDNQVPPKTSLDSNVVSFTIAPPALAAPNPATLGTPTIVRGMIRDRLVQREWHVIKRPPKEALILTVVASATSAVLGCESQHQSS